MALRIVFMGTPDFAVPTLTEIVGRGHEVVACYTQPPRPGGRRGLDLKKSPVHRQAEAFGIPVETPTTLKTSGAQAHFAAHEADVAVVVAYGLILPKPVLEAPAHGCLNLHASLLPRWRGAAPIQRAVMAGDAKTGIMVMAMDEGLDTGPVAMAETVPIGPDMTAGDLHDQLMRLGADLMVRALAALEHGGLTVTPQAADGASYARKIDKAETRIDWTMEATDIHNHIRGLSPFPGAWCEIGIDGRPNRVKVLHATPADGCGVPGTVLDDRLTVACGTGAVRITHLQRAGKAAIGADAFLRGTAIEVGTILP